METLTIKLLEERRSRNPRRKIDGYSGKLFSFLWSDEHDAYCYTTSDPDEVEDLFKSQARRSGAHFAPVLTIEPVQPPKPLSDELTMSLLQRELALPDVGVGVDSERIALAVLSAYDKGREAGARSLNPEPPASPAAMPTPAEPEPTPAVAAASPKRPKKSAAETLAKMSKAVGTAAPQQE